MQRDYSLEATGTQWTVSLWSPKESEQDCHDVWQSCLVLMADFEKLFSRFQPESFLRSLSGITGKFDVPKDFTDMLKIYREVAAVTDGTFTPLGAQLLSEMGYDENYSFDVKQAVSEVPDFSEAVEIIEDGKIEIIKPVHFDLGALGKGFLADKVLALIRTHDFITKVMINAGGDIIHWDADGQKIRVGLENPDNHQQVVGVHELGDGALASSAPSRRRWTDRDGKSDRHHIFDPLSGTNPDALKAAWVVHDSLAWADGIATALFVADSSTLSTSFAFEYLVIHKDNHFIASTAFDGAVDM